MKTLRLGLIGRGRWGENIVRTLQSFPDVSVGVIEKDDVLSYDFDGVLIATPSSTHAKVALPYLERGIPTFIEKPMATSLADAELLEAAAKKSGGVVFVGHIHLFNPAFIKAKELLSEIGEVHTMVCDSANANAREDSSILWDWLPHDLSMARAMFGTEPVSVEAKNLSDTPLSREATSAFLFGNTLLKSNMTSLSSEKRRIVSIFGPDGKIVLNESVPQKLALHRGEEVTYPAYELTPPLAMELQAFITAVDGGVPRGATLEDGLCIVREIAAAEKSVMENSLISIGH